MGTLRTRPATPHPERLGALHDGVAALLGAHRVHRGGAIEAWFVHPVSRSAMAMAEARGAILVALAQGGVAVVEYSPNTIKQAVTGHGGADKAQVRAMVAPADRRRRAGDRPRGRRAGRGDLPPALARPWRRAIRRAALASAA